VSHWFEEYGRGEVAPGLVTGAHPQDAADVAQLRAEGVTHVVNLCRDEEYPRGARVAVEDAYAAAGMTEFRLGSVDYGNLAPALIDAGVAAVGDALDAGGRVYLHCRAGWQRSATVAAAVLVTRDDIEPARALERIRRCRPEARPLPHQVADLVAWWRTR
jgi:atypical dual specificity phosphatase